MKRFKVRNNVNGLEFQVERESIEPLQPEWGKPAWTETKVTPAILDEEGNVVSEEKIETIEHAAEYSITEEDITGLREQEQANKEALAYLASTDWLVIRAMDSGEPMPADVKTKRAEARERIR